MTAEPSFEPPRDELVRRRWIPAHKVKWVRDADRIMLEHGSVWGTQLEETHHKARWKARYLLGLMVDLGLHERWELREHVEKREGGYKWAVEYVGRRR